MKKYTIGAVLALAALLIVVALVVVEVDSEARIRRQEQALSEAVRDLESRFFYRRRPELEWLASQTPVRDFLVRGEAVAPRLASLLSQTVGLLDVEVVYLVDLLGVIRAATDPGFVGINLTFRDYIRKGMSGIPAYAIATGVVTGTRGLYASAPVYRDGRVVGVVAFRTSSSALEQWQATYPGLMLVGPDDHVFASPKPWFDIEERWAWSGPSRVRIDGIDYRVARAPLDVAPGFTAVSLVAEELPWVPLALVDLVLILTLLTGLSVWRQWKLIRDRQNENRDRHQRELLLSHLMEGIAVFDTRAQLVWANPVFEKMIQQEAGAPPPTMDELWDRTGPGPWREVLEGRRPWVVFESVLRGRQGGWVPVSAGFTWADGRFLLSVLDGTERYQSDQLLRQSQKLTVLGQLSGGIAHDLNNMLGVLMGMADLLKMSLPEQDPLQESVELILTTLARAAGLSERMLTFARQTPMNRTPLDMAALLRELRFLVRTALPEGIQTEITVPEGPLLVDGDENLLLSALLNLILNAAESMPEGGLVRVTGERRGEDRFTILVEDQGRGMDKATLSRIFEPFFSTKLDKKGTGLGLSLVRRTILEHRGTIDVQSAEGKGTLVTVSLPLSV